MLLWDLAKQQEITLQKKRVLYLMKCSIEVIQILPYFYSLHRPSIYLGN